MSPFSDKDVAYIPVLQIYKAKHMLTLLSEEEYIASHMNPLKLGGTFVQEL